MIQDVAMKVGNMNVDVVTDALKYSTQRIMGPSYMTAGFGDGGACHPRDNIALRYMAKNLNLNYDLFDSIMKVREQQAYNMARYVMQYQMPVVILGRAFKPGIDQTIGSPSMLVGWYIENLDSSMKVYYDEAPDEGAYTYLIHDKGLMPEKFNPGSCIIDPYRTLKHSDATRHCVIKHYGNTR
jgi:UDPglucose 6-dehydrogenase